MGRTNASKSKAKEKSAAEAKHHATSPETKKITSHLQKKGDAISSCKRQKHKLSRAKKSKAHEEGDHSEKKAGKLKVTGIRHDSGSKENRKRESSKLAPSQSAKIIPVFRKKRRSLETENLQAAENQQSLGNTDPDTGTDSKVDSTNAVEKITEEKESVPENTCTPLLGHESKERDGTESKEIHLIEGVALDESKADVIENKDEKESVPENESASGGMGSESKECASAATEPVIEVQLSKGAALDESKAVGAEEKNDHQLKGLDRGEVVDATAPFTLEGTFMECESGSKGDSRGKSSHDDILEEEDMGLSEIEKTEVDNTRACTVFQSAVINLEDSEKAGTEHETIEGRDEPSTSTDGSKILSNLGEVDDFRDKKDTEENVTKIKKTLLHLNAVAVDGSLENGNVPVTTEPRSSEDLDLMEPEMNESDKVQVPNDGENEKHLFQDERENVRDEKLNGNTNYEVISEIELISSEAIIYFHSGTCIAANTPDTNMESPQINEVVADGNKLELERLGNEELSQKSSEDTGDAVSNTTLKGHMQCNTSTEDMNSVRQDNASICYPKNPDSDNHEEYKAKNDIQDEIEECQDQLCGSTQEFKVTIQGQPSSGNPVISCDDSGVCETVHVHTESDNIPKGRLKGVNMAGKVHSYSTIGEKLDKPISHLDAPSSMDTQATDLDTTPNNNPNIKMDVAYRLTSEFRQAEQEGDERQGCEAVSPQFSLQQSTDQYCSSGGDFLVDDMIDLTDSQMIELDQQCSMNNQQTDSLTNSASTREMGSGELESTVGCSVGVQTANNSTECADSSSIVQSMIRDLRQLNATVLDIKRQMDSFRIQRCQPSTSSSSCQQQHWKDYSRTWRKPFYKK